MGVSYNFRKSRGLMKQVMAVWFDTDTTIQSLLITQNYIAAVVARVKVISSARASCCRLEEAGFEKRHILTREPDVS